MSKREGAPLAGLDDATVLSSEASAAIGVLEDAHTVRADGVRVHR
ncbi:MULTISPECIES: hypothetical protein [Actinomadura]|nr:MULTISPECIES: hypothetical protein [Actinomadura]